MALFHVWRWQIIPKLFYYNFWLPAKIRASKNRSVIRICLWSHCLEHESRSCWQQPTVSTQTEQQNERVRMVPPRTFPTCNNLELTNFLREQPLKKLSFMNLSIFLLSPYQAKNITNMGHFHFSSLITLFPTGLVGRWYIYFLWLRGGKDSLYRAGWPSLWWNSCYNSAWVSCYH